MNLTRRENVLSLVLFNWFPGWWVSTGISQPFVTSALYWQRKTPYFFGKYCALFPEKEKTQDEWGKERNYHSIFFWPSPPFFFLDSLTSHVNYTKIIFSVAFGNFFLLTFSKYKAILLDMFYLNNVHSFLRFYCPVSCWNRIVSQKFNISKNVRIQDFFFLVSLGIKQWISFMKTSNF